jgi:5-methylcytosine-specific restriction endonuclease McrA
MERRRLARPVLRRVHGNLVGIPVPIKPSLRCLYPDDWSEISRRIRFVRARGRCEACRRPHGLTVYTLPDGRWYDAAAQHWISARGERIDRPSIVAWMAGRFVRVVLACAHLDHDPENSSDANLMSLCQRCHLIHDSPHHLVQRRITFRARSAIGDLFAGLYQR